MSLRIKRSKYLVEDLVQIVGIEVEEGKAGHLK